MKDKPPSLVTYFSEVNDPRVVGRTEHQLIDIIVITICAVVAGADGWEEITDYATEKEGLFRGFLELPNGIPTHHTVRRVIAAIDPESIRPCFVRWVQSLAGSKTGDVIAIDGKTSRGSGSRTRGKKPLHLVNAWSCGAGLVLGQVACHEKSNEITAIPELLDLLDIRDKIVTTDAMGAQKQIAQKVRDGGGDYVFQIKGSAGNIHDEAVALFAECRRRRWRGRTYDWYETQETGHGRKERRKYWVVEDEFTGEWWRDRVYRKDTWPDLKALGVVQSWRTVNGVTSEEARYYLTSLGTDGEQLAKAVRGHWEVETKLHWVLDVVFREDENQSHTGHAPHNLGLIRKVALNMIKHAEGVTGSIKRRRRKAGWDDDTMLKIVMGVG